MSLSIPMLLSLVAMNYHFVSDVIAGSVLGALIAAYAVHLAGLKCCASVLIKDSSHSAATRMNTLPNV
jgi:membrane-associated phospholipid phosphatase